MQFFNILTLVNSQEGLLLSQILSAGRGTIRIGERFHHPKLSILEKIDNFINKWLLGHHQLVSGMQMHYCRLLCLQTWFEILDIKSDDYTQDSEPI